MARVIILDFKDNDAAEAVVARLDELQAQGGVSFDNEWATAIQALGTIMASGAEVKSFHARPTRGCKCNRKGRVQGWTRTERFGWFVCPECRRPAVLVVKRWFSNINLSVGANNLLQELRDKLHPNEPDESPLEYVPVETVAEHSEVIKDPAIAQAYVPLQHIKDADPAILKAMEHDEAKQDWLDNRD